MFKIISIEAEPPIRNNTKISFNDDPFISDDEDDEYELKTRHPVKIEDFKNEIESTENESNEISDTIGEDV
jgi:hypothetical protein